MFLKKLKKLRKSLRQKLMRCDKKRVAISALAIAALLATICAPINDGALRPKTVAEFAKTSVKITDMQERGGGSGVILSSSPTESIVLTNAHVCAVAKKGGLVHQEERKFVISAYKLSKKHDICAIKVNADLKVNTVVAQAAPERYSEASISGHPALFPHVLTKGAFSARMSVQVMTGIRKCTQQDIAKGYGILCFFLGGIPIITTYDAQLVTGTILPGSSGSAVFNDKGEIAGLVFASRSRELSYALIVPQEYVAQFVNSEQHELEWIYPKTSSELTDEEEMSVHIVL